MSYKIANEFTFTWEIDNYSLCPQKNGEYLTSPPFTTENVGDSIWLLLLYPKGKDEESEEYISLYLTRFKGDIRTGVNNIGVELKFLGIQGNILHIVKQENIILHEGDTWGSKHFLKRTQLEEVMKKEKEDSISIGCTIINNKEQLSNKARTKINTEFFSFKWNIGIHEIKDASMPKVFYTTLFKIYLATSNGNIKLSLYKQENTAINPNCVTCRISLLDMHEREVNSKRATHSFLPDNDHVWEFPSFITTEYLNENEVTVVKNGNVTLRFEFSFSKGSEHTHILTPEGNNFSKQNNIICLKENFRKMYTNRLHSDVEFRVDGKRFYAHKAILAARSPVFLAMFNQDMLENLTGIVNIPDIEDNIFGLFLEYLYTATVDTMDWVIAGKLLLLANRYQVDALKADCSSFLKSNLNKMNLYEVLESSDMLNYRQLKEFVFGYIAENDHEILISPAWRDWAENNESLAAEVKHFLNSKK